MTTREQAMQFWNYFEASTRESLCAKYYPNRNFGTLTGSEIEEIWRKETQTENIYLNRLKEQYKQYKEKQSVDSWSSNKMYYDAMRLFCLDTQLISFNDIELMENEVNSSF